MALNEILLYFSTDKDIKIKILDKNKAHTG